MEQDMMPSAEKKRVLLERRAKDLAREPHRKADEGILVSVLTFLLAGERYAIETDYIREVYPMKKLTRMPCTPPFILGIINVHGRIISVIDLKLFLELPGKGLTDLNKVIILASGDMEIGVLADEVQELQEIYETRIQPTPGSLRGIGADFIRGVTKEMLIIINAGALLSDERIVVHEEVQG